MSPEDRKTFESLFPLPVRTAEKRWNRRCNRKLNAAEERISERNKALWDNLGRS
jgi:hypothetical protein